MKFSLILVPQVLEGMPEPYENITEQIRFAEDLGYDTVWLTEHHFSPLWETVRPRHCRTCAGEYFPHKDQYGCRRVTLPAPAAGGGGLGHAGSPGPGRVDVGVGRGNQPREFAGFDLTLGEAEQRFSESLDIIRRAWTEERFSYDGEYWQFPELSVLPKPYTKPHPPIWQAAISDYTVKKIIDRGINGLIGPYLCPHEILKTQYLMSGIVC